MSMRIEWATTNADIELLDRGERLAGYPEPITAPYGMLLSSDSGGFMVEGNRDELLAFLDKARAMVAEAPCTHEDAEAVVQSGPDSWFCSDCGQDNI